MNTVFLRVTLLHGHAFQMQMTQVEAEAALRAWLEGKLPPLWGGKETVPGGIAWGIKTACIQAMHTIDPVQVQPLQSPAPLPQPWRGSGLGRN